MTNKNLIKKLVIAMLFISVVGASAQDLYFEGYVRNTSGVIINEDLNYSEINNTFDLKAEYYGDISALNAELVFNSSGINEPDYSIKELYLDLYFDFLDFKMYLTRIAKKMPRMTAF